MAPRTGTRGKRKKEEGSQRVAPSTLAEYSKRTLRRKLGKIKSKRRDVIVVEDEDKDEARELGGACGARAKGLRERDDAVDDASEADVEWEDVDDDDAGTADGPDGDDEEDIGADDFLRDLPSASVEDPLEDGRFARVWTALVHRAHILCLVGRGQACDLVADDPLVQGRVLSMVPRHLLGGNEGIEGLGALEPILKFFSRHFSSSEPIAIDEEDETGEVEGGRPIGLRSRALGCLDDRWGTPEERGLLFCALCRSLGIRCRIVHCLLPAPKRPKAAIESHRAARGRDEAGERNDLAECWLGRPGTESETLRPATRHWVEVAFPLEGRWSQWHSADPVAGQVGPEGAYEKDAGLCVAFGGRGLGSRDVTRRYARAFHERRNDLDWAWWVGTRDEVCPSAGTEEEREEDRLLEERVVAQMKADWPKTLAAAKGHPYYVLFRHLTKRQCLVPKPTFTGKFLKSEPLYLRSEVRDLRTRGGWDQLGRRVREGEAAAKNEAGGPSLFGEWQTDAVVVEGVIPRSLYGNVKCPPLVARLPTGLVHLDYPGVAAHCGRLLRESKICDFAPALVGFRRNKPVVEGVVVLEQDQAAILDLVLRDQVRRAETERARRLRRGRRAWTRVLLTLLKRRELREEYQQEGGRRGEHHAHRSEIEEI